MPWSLLLVPVLVVLARRLGLGVPGTTLAALTFACSGGVLDAARAVEEQGNRPPLDPVAAATIVIVAVLALAVRRATAAGPSEARPERSLWLPAAIGLGLAVLGLAVLLSERGVVTPHVAPVRAFWLEPEPRTLWMLLPAFLFGGVSLLERDGPLRGRRVVHGLLAVVVALTLALGASVWLGPSWAFLLALSAADGLEGARLPARVSVLLGTVALVATVGPSGEPARIDQDELVGFTLAPPARDAVEGWVHGAARVDGVLLVLVDERRSLQGRVLPLELDVAVEDDSPAPEGARWFRADLAAQDLPGATSWSVRVEFTQAGKTVARRSAGRLVVDPFPGSRALGLATSLVLLSSLVLPWTRRTQLLVVTCTLLQAASMSLRL